MLETVEIARHELKGSGAVYMAQRLNGPGTIWPRDYIAQRLYGPGAIWPRDYMAQGL